MPLFRMSAVEAPVRRHPPGRVDFEKYRGQLKGTIVFIKPARATHPSFKPAASRYAASDIKDLQERPVPVKPKNAGEAGRSAGLKLGRDRAPRQKDKITVDASIKGEHPVGDMDEIFRITPAKDHILKRI